ncbi:MAG: DUF4157 domain-containing protein [Blastocatellia bacterium]
MPDKTANQAAGKGSAAVRKPAVEAQASRRQPTPVHPAAALLRAMSGPASELSAGDIRALQRTAGNRAVQRMLGALVGQDDERSSAQARHRFGESGDHHQQAADKMVPQIGDQSQALPPLSSTPMDAIQRRVEEETEPLQGKFENARKGENRTGLPDHIKAGIENLSSISLDDVRVHYNSSAPARLRALAYTQSTDIHLGPGQERHLAHEAWHVVQQKQGRVKSTLRARGVALNDDVGLEKEATVMGARAVAGPTTESVSDQLPGASENLREGSGHSGDKSPYPQASDLSAPVQLTDYDVPTHDDIKGIMEAAKITDFGPFQWDSGVPRFKLNPNYNNWTIADCVNKAIYEPESKDVAGEKGKKYHLIAMRRKAALESVLGTIKKGAEAILSVNDGKTPRAFVSLEKEDDYSGGHSHQRHILGKGKMTGHRQVALRAAFQKVDGVLMALDDAGIASVFADEDKATAAVKTALDKDLVQKWETHRKTLAKGSQVQITEAVNVSCVAYTKQDDPPGTPYAESEMPKYIDTSKSGERELYAGDYTGAGRPTDANGPDTTKKSLTTGGNATYTKVFVVVDPTTKQNTGGWAIKTAFPKP